MRAARTAAKSLSRLIDMLRPAPLGAQCAAPAGQAPAGRRALAGGAAAALLPPTRRSVALAAFRDDGAAAPSFDGVSGAATPSLEDAIGAACAALGRKYGEEEAAIAARCRANWFESRAAVAALSDEQAAALGVPLRLRDMLAVAAAPAAPAAPAPGNASRFWASGRDEAAPPREAAEPAAAAAAPPPPPAADEQPGWEDLPIEERICPDLQRFGHGPVKAAPSVTKRTRAAERYALREAELPPALAAELDALRDHHTKRFFGAQEEPIAAVTALKYRDHLRGALGWLHRERGVPLDRLSLRDVVPSPGREGVGPAFDYLLWLREARGVGVRTEGLALRSLLAAAKFLHHGASAVRAGDGDKPYSDLDVVKELRALSSGARREGKTASRVSDESLKWLDWPEYLQVVRELRRECAAIAPDGSIRPDAAVAAALQRYLIFAILACVPDRQRTLRELEIGRTLVKEGDRWVIRHQAGDYKTGRAYGERPPLVLAPALYPELEAYLATWRAALGARHGRLFTQRNGEPLTDGALYKIFWQACFRITGRRCNPHLVRDSIVTFLRGGNASERELEALALYMVRTVQFNSLAN
jgi:hypothetical protein